MSVLNSTLIKDSIEYATVTRPLIEIESEL